MCTPLATPLKEALAQQGIKAEMTRLQSVEALREKFNRERDMYLKRVKELEERLADRASRKGPTPPSIKLDSETAKGDASATSGGELVHGVKEKEKESKESISVSLTEGGHSKKPYEILGSHVGAGVVEGTATTRTTTIESPGTDLTSKGLSKPDKEKKATPSGKTTDKGLVLSGEKSDKVTPQSQP